MMNAVINLKQPPLHNWSNPVFTDHQLQVDVLRLDQMHPVLGGNKWMKLRGFLQKAMKHNMSGILTKGGPWSNHIHAVAWACRHLGLPLHVWIKGHAGLQTAMLADVQSWGASIRFVNRNQFYDEAAAFSFAEENNLLYIPIGGAGETGIAESTFFLQNLPLPRYHYAICAVGTATTFGGLAFVTSNFQTVLGIDAGTGDEAVAQKIAGWQQQLPCKNLLLNEEYTFGGFARYTSELIHFANDLFTQTGLPSDIVYTAKLFYAVKHLAAGGFFKTGTAILALHSGGLQGNRSLPAGLLQF